MISASNPTLRIHASSAYDYWPYFLLLLGLAFLGTKNPVTFSGWGWIALCCCAYSLWIRRDTYATEVRRLDYLLFFIAVLCCQFFSLDPSTSLYPTTQAIVFLLLWPALKGSIRRSGNAKTLWVTLWLMGGVTAGVTLIQMIWGKTVYGLLPLNPNFNAVWMASLAVAFLARFLTSQPFSWKERWANGFLAFLLATLVLLGPSRSALVALIVGGLYVLTSSPQGKRLALGVAACLLLLFLCFPQTLLSRFHVPLDPSDQNYRHKIWQVALQGALDHPVTGYGLGNFEIVYQQHAFPVKEDAVRYARTTAFAHNEYLQLAAELGWPAASIVFFWIASLFFCPLKTLKEASLSAKSALLTLFVAAFFNPLWHMPFLLYVTLFWAAHLLSSVDSPTISSFSRKPKGRLNSVQIGTSICLGSAVVLLGWFMLRTSWAAHQKWNHIVRWNPCDADAWSHVGFSNSNSAEAIPCFAKAVKHSPYQVYLHEYFAAALEHSLRPADLVLAMQEYQTALALAPHRAINALALGRLLVRENDPAAALPWFKQAQRIEPHYWESDLWIARCLFSQGQKPQAIRILKLLPTRRNRFLQERAMRGTVPVSSYERKILSYSPIVVQKELERFHSSKGNGIIPH